MPFAPEYYPSGQGGRRCSRLGPDGHRPGLRPRRERPPRRLGGSSSLFYADEAPLKGWASRSIGFGLVALGRPASFGRARFPLSPRHCPLPAPSPRPGGGIGKGLGARQCGPPPYRRGSYGRRVESVLEVTGAGHFVQIRSLFSPLQRRQRICTFFTVLAPPLAWGMM